MSEIYHQTSIFYPRAEEMSLQDSEHSDSLYLNLAREVWLSLGAVEADLEAEAAAMDRLAELAGQAAAQLRDRSAKAGESSTARAAVRLWTAALCSSTALPVAGRCSPPIWTTRPTPR
ncbi:hypothetical protein [Bailinhaonella thermotolerans]|uniref:hypothetical protein n=1 Tax=Bailinhaonella thermotolerans TaxID=1070861 RepID=UPI0011C49380|nr:hypothetical protein [Bailinhaonella thermotolerans]